VKVVKQVTARQVIGIRILPFLIAQVLVTRRIILHDLQSSTDYGYLLHLNTFVGRIDN
jgi:hypothetical protein